MPETERFRELLARQFQTKLDDVKLDLLSKHYELLEHWNQRMNLTRIRRVDDVVRLHYCESLFLASLLPSGALRVADVGSGPGFPGIPIAIMRPECQVTLIESNKRKAVFLSEASRELTNIKVLPFRAHDIEEKFDWTVSRAVSAGEVLSLRLSGNIALLVSAADVPAGWSIYEVPWTKGHYVARFHVEQA